MWLRAARLTWHQPLWLSHTCSSSPRRSLAHLKQPKDYSDQHDGKNKPDLKEGSHKVLALLTRNWLRRSITKFHITGKTVKISKLLNFTAVIHICPLLFRLLLIIDRQIIGNLRISFKTIARKADITKHVVNTTSGDLQPHKRKHIGLYCATHQAVWVTRYITWHTKKTLSSLFGLFVICLMCWGGTDLRPDTLLLHAESVFLLLTDTLLHLRKM